MTEGKHCSVCGKVLIAQEVTGKKEHKVSKWIIDSEAGCITKGVRHKECTECGKLLETEIIPAKGHSYGEIQTVAATCETAGYTYRVCTTCGYTEKVSEIPATGHTTSDWITDYDSTCAQAGARHKECTECHTILEFETIEPIEHEYGEWTIDKEPTNSTERREYRECARCGHLEERSLPKIEQEDKSGCESGCSGSVEERNWSLLIVVMFFAGAFVFLKRKQ